MFGIVRSHRLGIGSRVVFIVIQYDMGGDEYVSVDIFVWGIFGGLSWCRLGVLGDLALLALGDSV